METLKFKVGDKVRVKSLKWYNENKDVFGDIIISKKYIFLDRMAEYCGKVLEITEICDDYFRTGNDYIWQDWMLEDEPINETQEVEQLIKNSMETKEMTKEEVFLYLGNTKILCSSTEETVKVQVKLFELGMEWLSEHKGIYEDRYLLFINGKKKLQSTTDIRIWVKDINRQIEPTEILAIQIKEEKPKFDPKTLQPFNKVLVRQGKHVEWFARFFDFCEDDNYYTTSGSAWVMCVPYNEETKHLHGTTEEAPEFYRI